MIIIMMISYHDDDNDNDFELIRVSKYCSDNFIYMIAM